MANQRRGGFPDVTYSEATVNASVLEAVRVSSAEQVAEALEWIAHWVWFDAGQQSDNGQEDPERLVDALMLHAGHPLLIVALTEQIDSVGQVQGVRAAYAARRPELVRNIAARGGNPAGELGPLERMLEERERALQTWLDEYLRAHNLR